MNRMGMLLLAAAAWVPPGMAQDAADAIDCVSLTRLERAEIVDAQTLLFRMKGREIYLNRLPFRCAGLRSDDRFMYRVALPQLCRADTITVIYDMGYGWIEGPSCGLGRFEPVGPARVKEIRKAAAQKR